MTLSEQHPGGPGAAPGDTLYSSQCRCSWWADTGMTRDRCHQHRDVPLACPIQVGRGLLEHAANQCALAEALRVAIRWIIEGEPQIGWNVDRLRDALSGVGVPASETKDQ